MDWADEIAEGLEQEDSTEGYDGCLYFNKTIYKHDCAQALRDAYERGKKDGAHPLELKLIRAGLISRSGGGLW